MKFIHTGDTHIGKVYKDPQRNEDIKDVFRQLIDAAIKEKVDFIVHAGDLFNEGNPSLQDMLFVTDQLNRLRVNGIRVFIVPGSHDVGIGEEDSILELFERNGLLVNVGGKKYSEDDGSKVNLRGELYRNAFIAGVQGKRSRVEDEIFKRLKVEFLGPAWIRIFIFHHTISDLGEQFKDLDTESLPKGFEYYAAGHWHGHRDAIKYGDAMVQYPGSTEYCDEKEIVDNPNRGFYMIDCDENGIKKIDYMLLKTREKEIIKKKVSDLTAEKIEKELISELSKNSGKLLVIKLEGKMAGKKSDFNVMTIKNKAHELGYSYVSVNTSKLDDMDDKKIELDGKDVESIEKEYLRKKGYKEGDITLARALINAVENGLDTNAIIKKIREASTA